MRHTFGSRLAAAGINPLVIQELGRWKTASMVQRYAHFYPHHLRAGVESLSIRTAEKLQQPKQPTRAMAGKTLKYQ